MKFIETTRCENCGYYGAEVSNDHVFTSKSTSTMHYQEWTFCPNCPEEKAHTLEIKQTELDKSADEREAV